MSIRFNCEACRTVLKIENMISDEKKVRCTTCGIVILITPDANSPNGLKATIPDQTGKATAKSIAEEARKKKLLYLALGAVAVVILLGVAWTYRPPSNRAAIEGEVTMDGAPMEKGYIQFEPVDIADGVFVQAEVVKGQYRLARREGPSPGKNKIKITGMKIVPGKEYDNPKGRPGEKLDFYDDAGVLAKYNTDSQELFEVKSGSNKGVNFQVFTK